MGKPPSFQFYPGDWLKDPILRSCSFRAKGVWIDLICIAFECPVKGVLRSSYGRFTVEELSRMLTGNEREKRAGLKELIDKNILKKLGDGSFYIKRLYEICKLSETRRRAGKKGGNPALLLNQNPNQSGNQNPTPSSSSSSSALDLSIDRSAGADFEGNKSGKKSRHYSAKVGDFLGNINNQCRVLSKLPKRNGINFNPWQAVQMAVNENAHPEAITTVQEGMIKQWSQINNPMGYWRNAIKHNSAKFNERDHIKQAEKFKKAWNLDPELKKLVQKIGGEK